MRQVDWKMLLLMLRKRKVSTRSVAARHEMNIQLLDNLMYAAAEPKHCVGEAIVETWLAYGGLREEIPYRDGPVVLRAPGTSTRARAHLAGDQ